MDSGSTTCFSLDTYFFHECALDLFLGCLSVIQPSECKKSLCWCVCVLDVGVAAQSGRDAAELVAADDDHLERGDVGETVREVRQIVLMDEQGDQLLQPANTHMFIITPLT